jgi:hypothetical protein
VFGQQYVGRFLVIPQRLAEKQSKKRCPWLTIISQVEGSMAVEKMELLRVERTMVRPWDVIVERRAFGNVTSNPILFVSNQKRKQIPKTIQLVSGFIFLSKGKYLK